MAAGKCVHCGEEHPDSTRFCPSTGKPVGPAANPRATMMMFGTSPAAIPGARPAQAPSPTAVPAAPPAAQAPSPSAAAPVPAASPPAPVAPVGATDPASLGATRPTLAPTMVGTPLSAVAPGLAGAHPPGGPVPPMASAPTLYAAPTAASPPVPAAPLPAAAAPVPAAAAPSPAAVPPTAAPTPPEPVGATKVPPEPEAFAAARAAEAARGRGASGGASVPSWVSAPDAAGADEAPDLDPAVTLPPSDAPAKGIADLLKEAFALYKKHAKVFLMTAAILYVPASLLASLGLAALTVPATVGASQLEASAERMARRQEELARRMSDQMANGQLDARQMAETMKGMEAEAAAATALVGGAMGGVMVMLLGLLAWVLVAALLYATVIPLTSGALTIAIADRILGGTATWREHWGLLVRRIGPLVSALVPAAILCTIGFFFLVIPGLVLSFFFAFVPIVVIVEKTGGVAALKRSYALVKSDWLRVALVFLTFGAINWLAHVIGGMLIPGRSVFLSHLAGDLLSLALLPVPLLGAVLLYLDIRRKSEGMEPDGLRDELAALRSS